MDRWAERQDDGAAEHRLCGRDDCVTVLIKKHVYILNPSLGLGHDLLRASLSRYWESGTADGDLGSHKLKRIRNNSHTSGTLDVASVHEQCLLRQYKVVCDNLVSAC